MYLKCVKCDACGFIQTFKHFVNIITARASQLKNLGWTAGKVNGKVVDICPECSKNLPAAVKKIKDKANV